MKKKNSLELLPGEGPVGCFLAVYFLILTSLGLFRRHAATVFGCTANSLLKNILFSSSRLSALIATVIISLEAFKPSSKTSASANRERTSPMLLERSSPAQEKQKIVMSPLKETFLTNFSLVYIWLPFPSKFSAANFAAFVWPQGGQANEANRILNQKIETGATKKLSLSGKFWF